MRQLRWLAVVIGGAFLLAACGGLQAAVPQSEAIVQQLELGEPSYVEDWDGRGTDSLKCEYAGQDGRPESGWIHWVFSTKGASTDALLHLTDLDENDLGAFEPGAPLNASIWHFYTPFFDLDDLAATVYLYGGAAGPGGGLVISDFCPGTPVEPYGSLLVSKTAETSYVRTHDWSIAKSVDPDELYLYVDGSGDDAVTWTVDVTYEGFEDGDIEVSGTITILNNGDFDAEITSVLDELELMDGTIVPATVDCDVSFPYTLAVGETVECDYTAELDEVIDGFNTATVEGTYPDWLDAEGDPTAIDAFAEKDFDFGDPAEEIHETVLINDLSDLFGSVDLGTVTAPNGGQFTYDREFAWADFQDECGEFFYDNTATIIGDDDEELDSADATLAVYVQCLVFDGETAWAANGNEPRELRYTNRGNWATYVAYFGAAKTTTLFAGQTMDVGSVTFSAPDGGFVTIIVELASPWEFEDVSENLMVQDYAVAPSGNPAPGLFDHKKACEPELATCSIEVPANDFYGVHVNVGRWVPDPDFGP